MASEITVTAALSFTKSSSSDSIDFGTNTFTLTGTKFTHHRQSIGTAEEAISLGEVSAGGWCLFVNRDATNYVQIKSGTGATPLIRVKAGECALFRLDAGATTPFAQANTGACECEFLILVD